MPEQQTQAEAQTGGATGASGESASQNNQGAATGGQVDAAQTQQRKEGADVNGLRAALTKERQHKRDLASENERLMARMSDLEQRFTRSADAFKGSETGRARKPSFVDDPEGYEAYLEDRASERAYSRLREEQEKVSRAQAQQTHEASAVKAEQWVLSRSHLKEDPRLVAAVAQKISSIMAENPGTNPMLATESAYVRVCADLGISPDLSSSETSSPGLSNAGFRPSRAGGGGDSNKTYTAADVKQALSGFKPGSPERAAYVKEVERAAKEGRYQGAVIRIS